MTNRTPLKETAWAEINIAPRGKSWLHGQLIDSVHGFKTRQAMENAERSVCTCPSGDGSLRWPCPAHPPAVSTSAADASHTDPAMSRACDLLSSAIGTLMGQRAKIGYTDNSPVAALVNEAVEFLKPWPEQMPLAAAAPPAQVVLDYPWRARLLDGRPLLRDATGFAWHPELVLLDEGMKVKAFHAALGVEVRHTMAEDDLSMDEYDAMCDAENWRNWTPKPPSGEAWNLVAIFDTEDGPAAWWMRELRTNQQGVAA